jgi:hypothetical protein
MNVVIVMYLKLLIRKVTSAEIRLRDISFKSPIVISRAYSLIPGECSYSQLSLYMCLCIHVTIVFKNKTSQKANALKSSIICPKESMDMSGMC